MPFSRQTLKELIDNHHANVESRLPETNPRLRRSILGVLGTAHAGAVHGLHGHIDWVSKQVLFDTAEDEVLDRHASNYLTVPRKSAEAAQGNITCTGNNDSVIAISSVLQRSDGVEFITLAEATIVAGSATVLVDAVVGGLSGNTAAGTKLTFVESIDGVNNVATVAVGGIVDGLDIETRDAQLARLLQRISLPPQGGAEHDYIRWALEVPGVTRAWCYPLEDGAGTVKVRFVMDDKYTDGIPLAGDVTTVHDYVNAERSLGLEVNGYTTVAPVADPIDFQVTLSPNTAEVVAAVEAELRDIILRDSEPGGLTRISRINEAISLAAGEADHVLVAPAANIQHATNSIATFGSLVAS